MKVNCLTKQETFKLEKKIEEAKGVVVTDIIQKIDNPNARKIKYKDVRKINIGLCKKDLTSYRVKRKGAFYNCFAIIVRFKYKEEFREIHVKVFNTGKMEIPGVPKDSILNNLLDKLLEMLNSSPLNLDIKIKENSFETVLINSNFTCGFNIQRENLVDILKLNYKLSVSYDPCSYPGIMCKYYYYENKDASLQDGRLYKDEEDETNSDETEKTEKPTADRIPNKRPKNEPLLVLPNAIIIIPIAAIIIAIQTLNEILSKSWILLPINSSNSIAMPSFM